MILLAFFLPVAIYLLVLGGINRRRYPLMVSGVWDFVGILFASSGFLLVGGPVILSTVTGSNERWRMFWLTGRPGSGLSSFDILWQTWLFFSVLYFATIVAGSAYILWRQRHLTSIYNAAPALVERCLEQVLEKLQLQPVRSGGLYLFGLAGEPAPPAQSKLVEGIQGPHYLPAGTSFRASPGAHLATTGSPTVGADFLGQTAILELEAFAGLRHVTLRWDPVDSLFRKEIENLLEQQLSETPSEDPEVGSWMTLAGLGLLILLMLIGFVLLLLRSPRFGG